MTIHPLIKDEKKNSIRLLKERVFIEHINAHIKNFKILSSRYINKRLKHGLRMSLICDIVYILEKEQEDMVK